MLAVPARRRAGTKLAMAECMARTDETRRAPRNRSRIVLSSTAAAAIAFSLGGSVAALRSIERIAPGRRSELERTERRVEALGRRLDRWKQRERLGEWIEQEIRRANPRLDASEAREYSRLLLETTEKFNSVDPLFLLAIGIVESRFTAAATSHADAKGLYQIWPPTGRWLASDLGWEFSETMLFEPAKNTELAACYLDKLFMTYGDPRLVLAEYNGGPLNARRLKSGSHRLAAETREYVSRVMTVLDGLNRRLDLDAATAAGRNGAVRVAALEMTPSSPMDARSSF
jgi:soluble lytic murein transglycosylase-like protein